MNAPAPVMVTCLKCLTELQVDTSGDSVTCAKCGSVMDIVSDSWFDGEGDQPIWYLEWPE